MRGLVPLLITAALLGCGSQGFVDAPPVDRFYFPAGLAHVQVPGKTNGVLLVANANGDKRYTAGSIVAVDLDDVPGLPQLGSAPAGQIAKLYDLNMSDPQRALIGNFAGELHLVEMAAGTEWRAYVPTRAEGNDLFRVKLTMEGGKPKLSCITGKESDGQNCLATGLSMTPDSLAKNDVGLPRAPQPYGVTSRVRTCAADVDCCAKGQTSCARTCEANVCFANKDSAGNTIHEPYSDVWVTHIAQADSPPQSGLNYVSYLVHIDSDAYSIAETNFINIGFGASNSAVALDKWVYVTGRIAGPAPSLVRLVRYDSTYDSFVVYQMGSESSVRVSDARSVELSSDKSKLYMLARVPDSLIIADVQGPDTESPALPLTKQVPTIDAVIDLKVIPRAGKGDLIVMSGGTSIGSIAIYDVDSGQHVAVLRNAGAQPSHLTVDVRGNAARIFAGDFGDGRITVIDIDNLDRPQDARQVAFLGKQQVCLVLGEKAPNCKALTGDDR